MIDNLNISEIKSFNLLFKNDGGVYNKYRERWESLNYINRNENKPIKKRINLFFKNTFNIMNLIRGCFILVPIGYCTNQYAFSYSNTGWHYFQDLAKQLIENPGIDYRKTRYCKFIRECRFHTYSAFMTFHDKDLMRSLPSIPFGSYPWGHFDKKKLLPTGYFNDTSQLRRLQNYMWFESGNDVDKVIYKEYVIVFDLIRSVIVNGYNPKYSNYRFPLAVMLKKKSGELRFIQIDGAHRLSVLSALGYNHVVLQLDPFRYPPVLEENIDNWFYVKNGLISKKDALTIFELYFQLDGNERKSSLLGDLR